MTFDITRFLALLFVATLVALLCLVGTQLVFWTWTFPTNQATQNWTVLPADWAALRARWEYSHAVSGALNLAAVVTLVLSVSVRQRTGR